MYAILSILYPAKNNLNKTSSYKRFVDRLNFDGIDFPTPINQLGKLEKQNNLAINVYGCENNAIVVYRVSKQPASIKRINLVLIYKREKSHYVWIKDFNRLLFDQTKSGHRQHFCEKCLCHYSREDLLQAHILERKGIGE